MDRYPPVYDYRPEPSYTDKHEPVTLRPLEVYVSDGKIDKALRKLKRKLANEGVLKELKRRRRFMKPSAKRRRKQADAARRRRKRERTHDRFRG
jgi:small subunit ribosomal protein S21